MVLLLVEVFGGLISDIKKKVLQIMKKKVNVHCNIVIYSNINLEKGLKYSLCLENCLVTFTSQSYCRLLKENNVFKS
jgi:hypothetical protein